MAKVEHASDARVLVGIDISKHRHEVLLAVPGKTRRRSMTVLNTADDDQRLIEILRSFESPVTIGFEATGNRHRALMYALGATGFELKLVSSVALARTRGALHNSWDKNDPKDAQVILPMLEIGAVQVVFHDPLVAGTGDIQELSKTYEMVARAKTELWHRILTHYLPLYFPEADRFHRSTRGAWFLAFLEAFQLPHMITAMDKDAFIAAAWPVIGRRSASFWRRGAASSSSATPSRACRRASLQPSRPSPPALDPWHRRSGPDIRARSRPQPPEPEPATVGEGVAHKIKAPVCVRGLRHRHPTPSTSQSAVACAAYVSDGQTAAAKP